MKKNIGFLIFLTLVVSAFIVYVIMDSQSASVKAERDQQKRMKLIGKIQFKGKVIQSKIYRYSDKDYYLICVKLDYSNINYIYIYNDVCCLKIKNGVATMTEGVLDKSVGVPEYVEVNLDNKRKITLYYKNGDHDTFVLTLATRGLLEKELNSCN